MNRHCFGSCQRNLPYGVFRNSQGLKQGVTTDNLLKQTFAVRKS
jgi:hypothetical protein